MKPCGARRSTSSDDSIVLDSSPAPCYDSGVTWYAKEVAYGQLRTADHIRASAVTQHRRIVAPSFTRWGLLYVQ